MRQANACNAFCREQKRFLSGKRVPDRRLGQPAQSAERVSAERNTQRRPLGAFVAFSRPACHTPVMPIGPDTIRDMRPEDVAEVDALTRAAFGGDDERALVHALRRDGDMLVELVVPWQGRILAHCALSRMVAPERWLCLAPVSVLPEAQRGALAPAGGDKRPWQVGRRLVQGVVSAAMTPGQLMDGPVVVLGQPEFYERCGFSRDRARNLTSPYPISHTMLAGPGDHAPSATLVYPPAF